MVRNGGIKLSKNKQSYLYSSRSLCLSMQVILKVLGLLSLHVDGSIIENKERKNQFRSVHAITSDSFDSFAQCPSEWNRHIQWDIVDDYFLQA